MDLLEDGQLSRQVAGADGRGSLMDDVFEEVRDPVEPHRLLHGSNPNPQVGGHPGRPVILDDQDREAVVEDVLLDLQRWGSGLGGGRWSRRPHGR